MSVDGLDEQSKVDTKSTDCGVFFAISVVTKMLTTEDGIIRLDKSSLTTS